MLAKPITRSESDIITEAAKNRARSELVRNHRAEYIKLYKKHREICIQQVLEQSDEERFEEEEAEE